MGLPSTPTGLPDSLRPDKLQQTPRYFADLNLQHVAVWPMSPRPSFHSEPVVFVAAKEYQSEPPIVSDKNLQSQPDLGS